MNEKLQRVASIYLRNAYNEIRNFNLDTQGRGSIGSGGLHSSAVQSAISDFGFESLMSPWLTTKHQNSQQSPGRNFNKLRLFWKEVGFCPISRFFHHFRRGVFRYIAPLLGGQFLYGQIGR